MTLAARIASAVPILGRDPLRDRLVEELADGAYAFPHGDGRHVGRRLDAEMRFLARRKAEHDAVVAAHSTTNGSLLVR